MIRAKGRRLLTCHHEAGHALARWYFGHGTDRAVVLAGEEVRAGRQIENRRGIMVDGVEGLVDAYDICGYPFGPKGVHLDPTTGPEMLRLWAIARDTALTECYAGFYAESAYLRCSVARSMLAGGAGDMRGSAKILDAWELSEEARAAVAWAAEQRAAALVRSRMGSSAIRSVAKALLDRGEVGGDEIAGMCRAAYDGRECAFGAWSEYWPPTLAQIRAGYVPPPRQRQAAE